MSVDSPALPRPRTAARRVAWSRLRAAALLRKPELVGLLGLTAVLNLWNLGINGWANTYYSAAVRSMSTSWHDFLFVSLDPTGLMTVDKPPLSLWIQGLSARVFGFHPLSLLVPQALMGIAAVALLYDLTRRRFGRLAGFTAGLVLATTPVVVAISRHNNPDELLLLCSVAALWCALRAFDTGRTRWLVLCGLAVGLGFETKMGVALFVVPGIAVAWIWTRVLAAEGRRERLRAFGQLLWGGVAMAIAGLAWPLLVMLTPAADRPWISGTSDNSIWSLIFGYNGIGRVAGQTGGPGAAGGGGAAGARPGSFGHALATGAGSGAAGGARAGGPGTGGGPGGTMFGGATGPLRLLHTGLGDQGGWWLGFALVSGLGLLVMTRLRRRDPRTGWLLAIGGAFLVTAVVFSFASGIFHPYYVSLLAPFAAALVGAGVGELLPAERRTGGRLRLRVLAPLVLLAGAVTELVVLGELSGGLSWARPLIIAATVVSAAALAFARLSGRLRTGVLVAALLALLAAPAAWAAQTLGDATNGTFPTGGPASASSIGGPGGSGRGGGRFGGPPGGGFGAPGAGAGGFGAPGALPGAGAPPNLGAPSAGAGAAPSAGAGAAPSAGTGAAASAGGGAAPSAGAGAAPPAGAGAAPSAGAGGAPPIGLSPGGPFGGSSSSLTAAIAYARAHGGGTIGVSSQSTAANAILSRNASVAGLGGFSGRESSVSVAWLAEAVRAGRLRWILDDQNSGPRMPGDTRTGSTTAMTVAAKVCRTVKLPSASSTASATSAGGAGASVGNLTGGQTSSATMLLDCAGRAGALLKSTS